MDPEQKEGEGKDFGELMNGGKEMSTFNAKVFNRNILYMLDEHRYGKDGNYYWHCTCGNLIKDALPSETYAHYGRFEYHRGTKFVLFSNPRPFVFGQRTTQSQPLKWL